MKREGSKKDSISVDILPPRPNRALRSLLIWHYVVLSAETGWYGGISALHGEEWSVDGCKSPYGFP